MQNESDKLKKLPKEINVGIPDDKGKEENETQDTKEDEQNDTNEQGEGDVKEEDIDTLFGEKLKRDNQLQMAIQVLKSWDAITKIRNARPVNI